MQYNDFKEGIARVAETVSSALFLEKYVIKFNLEFNILIKI